MSHPNVGHPDSGHDHEGGHDHGHEHEHGHGGQGLAARWRHVLRPRSHEAADQVAAVMEGSAEGMRGRAPNLMDPGRQPDRP